MERRDERGRTRYASKIKDCEFEATGSRARATVRSILLDLRDPTTTAGRPAGIRRFSSRDELRATSGVIS